MLIFSCCVYFLNTLSQHMSKQLSPFFQGCVILIRREGEVLLTNHMKNNTRGVGRQMNTVVQHLGAFGLTEQLEFRIHVSTKAFQIPLVRENRENPDAVVCNEVSELRMC